MNAWIRILLKLSWNIGIVLLETPLYKSMKTICSKFKESFVSVWKGLKYGTKWEYLRWDIWSSYSIYHQVIILVGYFRIWFGSIFIIVVQKLKDLWLIPWILATLKLPDEVKKTSSLTFLAFSEPLSIKYRSKYHLFAGKFIISEKKIIFSSVQMFIKEFWKVKGQF